MFVFYQLSPVAPVLAIMKMVFLFVFVLRQQDQML